MMNISYWLSRGHAHHTVHWQLPASPDRLVAHMWGATVELKFGLFPFGWVNGTGESQPAGLLRHGAVALAPLPRMVAACLGPLPILFPKLVPGFSAQSQRSGQWDRVGVCQPWRGCVHRKGCCCHCLALRPVNTYTLAVSPSSILPQTGVWQQLSKLGICPWLKNFELLWSVIRLLRLISK